MLGSSDQIPEACTLASDADVQRRFMAIAQHYRALAQAEERNAERMDVERRSRNTGP